MTLSRGIVPLGAILGIVIVESIALLQGINGVLLSSAIAALSGIGGFELRTALERRQKSESRTERKD